MANLVISRPDLFPDGTSVSAFPAISRKADGSPPGGPALETQTVSSGIATFTTLANDTAYTFYAAATGRYLNQRLSTTDTGSATGTLTTTSGTPNLSSVTVTTGALAVGQRILAAGIPPGSYIISGSGNAWVMSAPATASGSGVAFTADGATPAVANLGGTAVPKQTTKWQAKVRQRRQIQGTAI